MRRPNIKSSLLLIFSGITLLFGLVAYLAVEGLRNTNGSTEEIATRWLPSVQASQTINLNMTNLRLAYRDHIIAQTEAEKKTREEAIAVAESTIRKSVDAYIPLISSDRERDLLKTIKESVEGYIASSAQLLVLSRANKTEEAGKYLGGEMRAYSDKLKEATATLVELNVSGSNQAAELSKTVFASIEFYLVAAIGFAGLLVLGAVFFVLTGIANPIIGITAAMRRLSEGDTASEIPFAGRADEIGSMAAAVEIFRQAAITNKRMAMEADEIRSRTEADRIAAQNQAEADASERLRIATSGLAAGLKRLAGGDLAFQLNETFAPDFEALRHDFNQSVTQLGATLRAISESIGTIDEGTREISSGASDLSKRTEQQAASLEETAAALEEITANVSNSTKRTEETRKVATEANHSAVISADVVSHAEEAMDLIAADFQHHQRHRRDRIPDQSAGAQCRRGSSESRRSRQGLCRRRPGGARTRPALGKCCQGNQGADPEFFEGSGKRRQARARYRPGAQDDRRLHHADQPAHGFDRNLGEGAVDRSQRSQRRGQPDGSVHAAERPYGAAIDGGIRLAGAGSPEASRTRCPVQARRCGLQPIGSPSLDGKINGAAGRPNSHPCGCRASLNGSPHLSPLVNLM
jgi:methyl-accepting chemotaxis protein